MNEAKNRYGEIFKESEAVLFHHGYHNKMEGRIFIIKEIIPFDACESGHMIQLIDKESGSEVKRKLDTNWLLKIK